MRWVVRIVLALVALTVFYLLVWPVPLQPEAWRAPSNPGYTGDFAPNSALAGMDKIRLPAGLHGPEDIALDALGRIYVSTHEGKILRFDPDGSNPQEFADTGGRPLGIDFDNDGNLIVADGYKGLLSISPDGTVKPLATEADGKPILYADDVDVARDGKIYFSDASMRFSPTDWGGTLPASLLDLMEHSDTGRLLVHDPATGETTTVMGGISFANGVAISDDQSFVLVNETGEYRVRRYWLTGEKAGQQDILIDRLPGFPDNVSTGRNGRFWVALVSPRSNLLDQLAEYPFVRKIVQRLPAAMRPQPLLRGHVIAVDRDGKVLANLQDPKTGLPTNTAVTETANDLYIASLTAPFFGRFNMREIQVTDAAPPEAEIETLVPKPDTDTLVDEPGTYTPPGDAEVLSAPPTAAPPKPENDSPPPLAKPPGAP